MLRNSFKKVLSINNFKYHQNLYGITYTDILKIIIPRSDLRNLKKIQKIDLNSSLKMYKK